jgi:hypothetical protein
MLVVMDGVVVGFSSGPLARYMIPFSVASMAA